MSLPRGQNRIMPIVSGVSAHNNPGNGYVETTRAKRERACALQARLTIRVDEACEQQHCEVHKGVGARDQ